MAQLGTTRALSGTTSAFSGGGACGGSRPTSPADLVRRSEAAVTPVREPGETWDVGNSLDDAQRRKSSATAVQFATKIASISVLTCSSVCRRAMAISFTMSERAVSSILRSPKLSCLSVFKR